MLPYRHGSWRVRAAAIAGTERLRDPTLLGDLVDRLASDSGGVAVDVTDHLLR